MDAIQAEFKYRYKDGRSFVYILKIYGDQQLEVKGPELKKQILAGHIAVKGLKISNNCIVPEDKTYYLKNFKKDTVQPTYVNSLIEGLVVDEDIFIGEKQTIRAGTVLDSIAIKQIQQVKNMADTIFIRDGLGIRNYIANDTILCDQLSKFYTFRVKELLQQQTYTDLAEPFLNYLYKHYLNNKYFQKDKNLLYQLYLLYEYHTYTFEHCCNVAVYSALVGLYLGLSDEYIDDLFLGGLLHDIGKRKIPVALLDKNGKLSDEEFEIIMTHAYIGYTIVSSLVGYDSPIFKDYSNVERMQRLTQEVMGHHAKLDGTGYPKGYSEEYLTTQIITVCDMFDAMTSARSYKTPFQNRAALDILTEEANKHKISSNCIEALENIIEPEFQKSNLGYVMFKNGNKSPKETYTSDIYTIIKDLV